VVTEFAVVGDATLDVVVAQSAPRRDGADVPAEIHILPGGQGGNVAVRLARSGESVRLVAPLADDAAGRLLREALLVEHITLAALPADRSGVVIALLDEAGERTMLSDRRQLDPSSVADAVRGTGWLHCSGYPLLDEATGDALADILGGRAQGTRLSVAGGSVPPDAARVSRLRTRLVAARPDLLVLSANEAEAVLGHSSHSAKAAASELQELAPLVVVTHGAAGSAAAAGDLLLYAPADDPAGTVVDATGAGDAYVAGLLLELARSGTWPPGEAAIRRGMAAGSRLGALAARVVGAQTLVQGERVRA
jgi:fructokinase